MKVTKDKCTCWHDYPNQYYREHCKNYECVKRCSIRSKTRCVLKEEFQQVSKEKKEK